MDPLWELIGEVGEVLVRHANIERESGEEEERVEPGLSAQEARDKWERAVLERRSLAEKEMREMPLPEWRAKAQAEGRIGSIDPCEEVFLALRDLPYPTTINGLAVFESAMHRIIGLASMRREAAYKRRQI